MLVEVFKPDANQYLARRTVSSAGFLYAESCLPVSVGASRIETLPCEDVEQPGVDHYFLEHHTEHGGPDDAVLSSAAGTHGSPSFERHEHKQCSGVTGNAHGPLLFVYILGGGRLLCALAVKIPYTSLIHIL